MNNNFVSRDSRPLQCSLTIHHGEMWRSLKDLSLQAVGAVLVLFALSWRLGPILAGVIVATAVTANVYKQQTKAVEAENAAATSEMNNIASQAFESITTVRWGEIVPLRLPFPESTVHLDNAGIEGGNVTSDAMHLWLILGLCFRFPW